MEITRGQAFTELWGAISELMPYPCECSWNDPATIHVAPRQLDGRAAGAAIRTPIAIRFGQRGLAMYQGANDLMRQHVRDDVVYVVTLMVRAYNLGLHSARDKATPFVIDCELLLHPD
jgi:hypothetical protein